jgi:hypothetical protein
MNHSVAICTRNCLEIKRKTENVFFAPSWNTYSPIHLFTFSPHCLEIKRKTENILLLRVKTTIHLFTYSPFPFILPFVNFRRVELKRRCSHHIHQNWAYVTKRRLLASLLLLFWHDSSLCNRACLEMKWKMASFFLVGVKTTIHLFTYSLSGNKIKKWTMFSWSELKQLFTYSPIHLLLRRFRLSTWAVSIVVNQYYHCTLESFSDTVPLWGRG